MLLDPTYVRTLASVFVANAPETIVTYVDDVAA